MNAGAGGRTFLALPDRFLGAAPLPVFLLGSLLAYRDVLSAFFCSDDFGLVWWVSLRGVAAIASPFAANFFRPVVWASLVFDHLLWGLHPAGYHVTNVLLHGLDSWLVYLLASRLLDSRSDRRLIAWLCGLVFLLLPSHTEAVSWVSGRTDLIATGLALGCLVFFLDYRRARRPASLALSVMLFVAALLAKESAVTLPFILLATSLLPTGSMRERRVSGRSLLVAALFSGCFVAYCLLRWAVLGRFVGGYGAGVHLHFSTRGIVQSLIISPVRTFLPPLPPGVAGELLLDRPHSYAAAVTLIVIAGFLFLWLCRSDRVFAFAGVAWLLALGPMVNLPVSLTDTQGERLLYLPSVFLSLAAVLLLRRVVTSRGVLVAVVVLASAAWVRSIHPLNVNWRLAGEIARETVAELDEMRGYDRLFVLEVPDNLRGAYIFRNGLGEAILIYGAGLRFSGGALIGLVSLQTPHDAVSASLEHGVLSVRSESPGCTFSRAQSPMMGVPPINITATEFSPAGFEVKTAGPGARDLAVYWSAGGMHRLKAPG